MEIVTKIQNIEFKNISMFCAVFVIPHLLYAVDNSKSSIISNFWTSEISQPYKVSVFKYFLNAFF